MFEIITITFIEDNADEKAFARLAKSKLESLGRLCVLNRSYFDEFYGDIGPSPKINFPDGTTLQGKSQIEEALELSS